MKIKLFAVAAVTLALLALAVHSVKSGTNYIGIEHFLSCFK